MSTDYPIIPDTLVEGKAEQLVIQLEESSCKFRIGIYMTGEHEDIHTEYMDEDEIIDVAVRLLGPLFYFNPSGPIIEKLAKRLKERGYS